MVELISEDREKEFFDYFKRLKNLLRAGVPWNEESKRFQKEQMDIFSRYDDLLYKLGKSVYGNRNDKNTDEQEKWNTIYHVICPDCKEKLELKPLGEIMLDDGLTYFQFYCKKCFRNFESKKPNNDDDLVKWNALLIERLMKTGKGGMKHYEVIGMKESDFKETLKKHKDLKKQVADRNLNRGENEIKYREVMKNINITLDTLKQMVDDQSKNINVFGIHRELATELEIIYSNEENEVISLLYFINEMLNNQYSFCRSDKRKAKLNGERIEFINKEMASYYNKIKEYLQSKEESESIKWNNMHDVICTHCKKDFILFPYGEVKDSLNYVHFAYFCPDCKLSFSDPMLNNDRDIMKLYENAINNHQTKNEDVEKLLLLHGKTDESIKQMKAEYLRLKEIHEKELKHEKSIEDLKNEHKETVKKHLEELILIKYELMIAS